VVDTQPKAFDDAVPATLKAIRVTFDQMMKDGAWSWAIPRPVTLPARQGDVRLTSIPAVVPALRWPNRVRPESRQQSRA